VSQQDLVKQFPERRIKPFDGMVVTAEVWEEAHEYHRQQQRYHSLLAHGAGILTGLEVIASDPPDSSVYILPGMAVDASGQVIVLPEPFSYDLGAAQGALHLLLSYVESQPRPDERAADAAGPTESTLYIRSQFSLETAGTPPAPDAPHVELARIRRAGVSAPIQDAPDSQHPAVNQIDLRFRRSAGAPVSQPASVAVCYLPGVLDEARRRHGRGAGWMARAGRQAGVPVWVDDGVPLISHFDLNGYTLVYVVGQASFALKPDEMNVLYAYVQNGGTILYESCRQGAGGSSIGEPPADEAFLDLLSSFGTKMEDVPAEHALLTGPNLFGVPPAGFETVGNLKLGGAGDGGGIIFSTFDYGCVWQAQQRGKVAQRQDIRSAHEWGGNVIAYALSRAARE